MRNRIKPEHRCTRVLGRIRQLGLAERRRLARLGAMASVASERAHRWTPDTARDAGRKGGLATARRREAASALAIRGQEHEETDDQARRDKRDSSERQPAAPTNTKGSER